MVTIKEYITELKNQYKNLLSVTWEFPGQSNKKGILFVSLQNIDLKTLQEIIKNLRNWFKFKNDKVHIRAYDVKQFQDNLFSFNENETEDDKKHFEWVASLEDDDPEKFHIEREKINREGFRRNINFRSVLVCLIEFEDIVLNKN